MSFFPAGLQTYTLQSSVSSTQTTITLSSFKVPVSGEDVTMALMNTAIAYGTIAPRTSQSEFISFTGITQNADGTATLTGVTRGLDRTYPYTTDNDFKLPHAGNSKFILSDAPQVFNKYSVIENDETFTGLKTFSQTPVSTAGLPVNSNQLATKQYVDNTATGTTSINRVIVSGTAGETIAVDQLVYMKASDGRWWLADADAAASSENVQLGIAQGAGTAGNTITNGVLISGLNTFSALTLTANTKYYVSNTAGGFSSTPGTNEVTVGQSQTTTTFLFTPRNDQQITENEQDALAGTSGNPSATNKYVTANDESRNYRTIAYGASSGGTDTYAITLSPAPTAYATGMSGSFKADVANTGAATLNVNALGAKTLKKPSSTGYTDLATGDILANQIVDWEYDGTDMIVTSTLSTAVLTPSTAYYNQILGLTATGVTTVAVGINTSTSETDGSVLYTVSIVSTTQAIVQRWAKDSSGSYYNTHSVTTTVPAASQFTSNTNTVGLVVIGSYVYLCYDSLAASIVRRFDKADLANDTAMTISGTDFNSASYCPAYTNGTDLIVCDATTTWYRYTISGTTITNAATVTTLTGVNIEAAVGDGSNVYFIDNSSVIYKYSFTGTLSTSVTRVVGTQFATGNSIALVIGNSTIFYLINAGVVESNTTQVSRVANLIPIARF